VNDEKHLLDESDTKLRYLDPPKVIYIENMNNVNCKHNQMPSFKTFDNNFKAVETE